MGPHVEAPDAGWLPGLVGFCLMTIPIHLIPCHLSLSLVGFLFCWKVEIKSHPRNLYCHLFMGPDALHLTRRDTLPMLQLLHGMWILLKVWMDFSCFANHKCDQDQATEFIQLDRYILQAAFCWPIWRLPSCPDMLFCSFIRIKSSRHVLKIAMSSINKGTNIE